MTTQKMSKNISTLVEGLTDLFVDFLGQVDVKKGKVKVKDVIKLLKSSDSQDALVSLLKSKMPKAKRVPGTKKLKDPDAPKGVRSSYILFCMDVRDAVTKKLKKSEGDDFKQTMVAKALGAKWGKLTAAKKKKYEKLATKDKVRHSKEMEDYTRPSDEELEELPVNKRRRRKAKKDKKRKDPDAPKRPISAYMLFSKATRAQVKEDNPDIKARDVMRELGRLWTEDMVDAEYPPHNLRNSVMFPKPVQRPRPPCD